MICALENTESLSIRTLFTVKPRDLIAMMNHFQELEASDLDFMRDNNLVEIL
jgi:hypothetical protein